MSFVDGAIPGVVGLIAAVWPRAFFIGSRATPTPEKLRWIRRGGIVLLCVAVAYSALKFAAR